MGDTNEDGYLQTGEVRDQYRKSESLLEKHMRIMTERCGKIADVFAYLDKDGNGTIDQKEFTAFFKEQGQKLDDERIKKQFSRWDKDKNGLLDQMEVAQVYKIWPELINKHSSAVERLKTGEGPVCNACSIFMGGFVLAVGIVLGTEGRAVQWVTGLV